MSDIATQTTAEIAARVLDLHEKATPGPWFGAHSKTYAARIYRYDGTLELNVGAAVADQDAALIAYYRTACVELAKRCLKAEAVAAKSREEDQVVAFSDTDQAYECGLERAALWHDEQAEILLRDHQSACQAGVDCSDSVGDLLHYAELHRGHAAVFRTLALKSSRTDSGQPPATGDGQ